MNIIFHYSGIMGSSVWSEWLEGDRNLCQKANSEFQDIPNTWQSMVPPRLSAAGGCRSSQVPPLSNVMTDRMLSSVTDPLIRVATNTPLRPSTRWRSANGSLAKYLSNTQTHKSVSMCHSYLPRKGLYENANGTRAKRISSAFRTAVIESLLSGGRAELSGLAVGEFPLCRRVKQ